MGLYTHVVHAWKDSNTDRVPIACNTAADARNMFEIMLRAESEYDHATLSERRGTSDYFQLLETGHRAGTVAAGLSAGTVNTAMIAVVDQCYRNMMDANGADPYSHDEYDRCDQVLRAALALLTNGDMPYARSLHDALSDSGEEINYYLTEWSRDVLCVDSGEMSREDYEATLRWAVECEEGGSTWTEAFETREEADQRAAELVANTTVVDRHADKS